VAVVGEQAGETCSINAKGSDKIKIYYERTEGDLACLGDLGCDDGDAHTQDVCVNPGQVDSACVYENIMCLNDLECDDADDYTEDACVNPGQVDSFCTHDDIACFSDVDCDDGDEYTEDVCIDGGETNSFCSYGDFECLVDNDCEDESLGMFCQDNNVYENMNFGECDFPGNVGLGCDYNEEDVLVQICNDNDDDTADFCVEAGNDLAFCYFVDLDGECERDADCGEGGLVGDTYCVGDDVVQDSVEYTCNEPGEIDSFCSEETTPELIENCEFGCAGGVCLEDVPEISVGGAHTIPAEVIEGEEFSLVLELENNLEEDMDIPVEIYVNGVLLEGVDVIPFVQGESEFSIDGLGPFDSGDYTIEVILDPDDVIPGEQPVFLFELEVSEEPQACVIDADCGGESYSENFCVGDNIYRTHFTPGCVGGFCGVEEEDELVEACEFGCDDGECEGEQRRRRRSSSRETIDLSGLVENEPIIRYVQDGGEDVVIDLGNVDGGKDGLNILSSKTVLIGASAGVLLLLIIILLLLILG